MNLEQDFFYETIPMKPDYEGEVTVTLISAKANTGVAKPVLYLHGFIDYFFHPHVAAALINNGYDFYALELRKYGHSLLPHQHPNYCRSMDEYFEELDLVINKITTTNKGAGLILLGHSTGGLLSSYYMHKGALRKKVTAMVLNSPFLELNEPFPLKQLAPFFAGVIAAISPFAKKEGAISPVYAQSVHKDFFGEWDFNQLWKPINGFPAYFAWVSAISKAQHYLYANANITIPILLLHSSQSAKSIKNQELAQRVDTVLNVKHIKQRGQKLGTKVDTIVVENGMHDLFLSPKPVREIALEKMISWLNNLD